MNYPTGHRGGQWSIILAGGNGERMRPLTEQWLGYHKPKQFCAFVGKRSLLQHTWDRADQITPAMQKVTVVTRAHLQHIWLQLETHSGGQVIVQPQNRDTAAGIFLPLTYVRAWDPEATVVLHPADHFVFPENRFVETVRRMVRAAERLGNRVILLGVPPTDLEQEYGWIKPEWTIGGSAGTRVKRVEAFLEKPDQVTAQRVLAFGGLWNTLVLTAKVETLWELARQYLPEVMGYFEELGSAIGTPREGLILEDIYHHMPIRNFSTDLLQQCPDRLGVIELRDVLWSDWGQPERIAATLREIGKAPNFPLHCLDLTGCGKKPVWGMLEGNKARRAACSPFDLPAASRKTAQGRGVIGPVLRGRPRG